VLSSACIIDASITVMVMRMRWGALAAGAAAGGGAFGVAAVSDAAAHGVAFGAVAASDGAVDADAFGIGAASDAAGGDAASGGEVVGCGATAVLTTLALTALL
jgi:hypothetical protein